MLNWLHFTDLHYGLTGQRPLWPNVREAFFDDLTKLHKKSGPWHVVFFTGDLVQQGRKDEFDGLDKEVLRPLWKHLESLGDPPLLLAVPGNHDLVRPDAKKPTAAVKLLLMPKEFQGLADQLFDENGSEYKQVIDRAFVNYRDWWQIRAGLTQLNIRHGLLPGDFSATLPVGDRRIGVVGLNTSFLQLTGGNYRGKLAWDIRQFHHACGGDGTAWVKAHDACLLLTHQGPQWLSKSSSGSILSEINPAGRFAVHLFGHEHELHAESRALAGGRSRNLWQGASLFGLEKYGEPPKTDRRHGYSAGRLEFSDTRATLRLWPRKAVNDTNGWRFIPDHERSVLPDDESTSPIEVVWNKPEATAVTRVQPASHDSERALRLEAYRAALLRTCDIINLSGLPEGDRNLAMERFLLRNLYVPLRVRVDVAAKDAGGPDALAQLEKRREQQRLFEAGRGGERGEEVKSEPVGSRLQEPPPKKRKGKSRRPVAAAAGAPAKRLVVLGDPGSGKTTLLRWMATAYLLRIAKDDQLGQLPDAATLPEADWWPILIRCRELDHSRLQTCALEDLLRQAIYRLEIPAPAAVHESLAALLKELLIDGKALLLIDGLDEITDPGVRGRFCEQLEQVAAQYEHSPIVVTSRIVGYREMNRRLGRGFEHTTLADLTAEDKDQFVARWCEVTELPDARKAATDDLRAAVHSSDRIERLTGNPMLLTTLALVKRKVRKLPTRRHELYREAVEVLLNWRSEIGERIDQDEALPQLQYVAYAMCRDGRQQLRRGEVLQLLADMRRDYGHITAIHPRSPEEFLRLLEERTSLLVEVGEQRHEGEMEPVYEFRHLTFQEYLAGLALVKGRYPGHDRASTLAERVAPLAGQVALARSEYGVEELLVTENWREAIRLCVASCNDDDVDAVLLAILHPAWKEDANRVARPRAILATLCLADEPNVSAGVADEILYRLVAQVHSIEDTRPGISAASGEVGKSIWSDRLKSLLLTEFIRNEGDLRSAMGILFAGTIEAPAADHEFARWISMQMESVKSKTMTVAVGGALSIMQAAFTRQTRSYHQNVSRDTALSSVSEALLTRLVDKPAIAHAAAWALLWLTGWDINLSRSLPLTMDVQIVGRALATQDAETMRFVAELIRVQRLEALVPQLAKEIHHAVPKTRQSIFSAVVSFADELTRKLLSLDASGTERWLEVADAIDPERIAYVARKLDMPESEVKAHYQRLAPEFGLRLEF